MKFSITIILVVFLFSSCDLCDIMGAYELGNNLVLLEGDKLEDRIIVRCTGRSQGCCRGGSFVIPTSYEDKYNHYVESVESNEQWVIAKSIRLMDEKQLQQYWIINKDFDLSGFDCSTFNCDSVVQLQVIGPLEHESFLEKVEQLRVNLEIK